MAKYDSDGKLVVRTDPFGGLVDPNADRIVFWDDSAGTLTFLTPGTNLSISGTTLNATGGGFPPQLGYLKW